MGQTPKPRSARPSALPGRCLSADRVPAAQPWGRGGSGAGAAASPAARARSAAPGRPRLQPEPDSRRRRRHLRLLPREGGGPPARKPGPRGVASRARLAPLYSMNYLHGSHIHLPPSRCFPIPPVLKISRGSSSRVKSVCLSTPLYSQGCPPFPYISSTEPSHDSSKTCAFRIPLLSISSSCPVEFHLPPSFPRQS